MPKAGRLPAPSRSTRRNMGGKRKNMPQAKRKPPEGRGAIGKMAVARAKEKDRATNRLNAAVVPAADGATLQGFVRANAEAGATIHTDDAAAYRGMAGFKHEAVRHSIGECARGMAHTNGMESFRAMPKCGYHGTFHHFSTKPCNAARPDLKFALLWYSNRFVSMEFIGMTRGVGRPLEALVLSDAERSLPGRQAHRRQVARSLPDRCRMVLRCAEDPPNKVAAAELGVDRQTVGKWRRRFLKDRLDRLSDGPRSGRPRTIGDDRVAHVLGRMLHATPDASGHTRTADPRLQAQRDAPAVRRHRHRLRQWTKSVGNILGAIKRFCHRINHDYNANFNPSDYVNEFAARQGLRERDTIAVMSAFVAGMIGRRLMYRRLTGRGRDMSAGDRARVVVPPTDMSFEGPARMVMRHKPKLAESGRLKESRPAEGNLSRSPDSPITATIRRSASQVYKFPKELCLSSERKIRTYTYIETEQVV